VAKLALFNGANTFTEFIVLGFSSLLILPTLKRSKKILSLKTWLFDGFICQQKRL